VSARIRLITDSQRPVFLVNSRLSLFSATSLKYCYPSEAILIPKLRMYFAEFLNASSPARLRILILPTCVGLRYGLCMVYLRGSFLSPWLHPLRSTVVSLDVTAHLNRGFAYGLINSLLIPGLPSPGRTSPHASPHSNSIQRYGNMNPFPIAYAFRPRLRGRLTLADDLYRRKPSVFGGTRLSPLFSLLMPAFSLPLPPVPLTRYLHRPPERSPTTVCKHTIRSFGT
jgi:hypothetical protein